jgi:hypothetical protein
MLHVRFHLQYSGEANVVIYDLAGRIILRHQAGKQYSGMHDEILDVSGLKQGIYLCRISTPQESSCQKVIVRR